jgi:membrane protein DedA with SNARE-associated domain
VESILDGPWAYLGLFVVALLENSVGLGLFFPVETALVGAAALCATGALSSPWVLAAIIVGAIIGDSIGYLVGRRFGPTITSRLDGHLGITNARIEQANHAFRRWGMWAVAIGRLIPAIRFLVVLLAGDLGMPYRRFLVADVLGILTWTSVHFALGYGVGSGASALGGTDELVAIAVLGLALMVAGALMVRWWTRHQAATARVAP